MRKVIKIENRTKRNINIEQWKKWIKTYCNYPPLKVFIINEPKETKKLNIKGGFVFEEIYVLVRKRESMNSINWTFLHELAHWIIYHKKDMWVYLETANSEINKFMAEGRMSKEKISSKYFEDILSYEEIFADLFAIMVMSL